MATPTNNPILETSDDDEVSDVPTAMRSLHRGAVSAKFQVTRGLRGEVVENAKVKIGKLYLRQIFAGPDANQSDVIQPNHVTGLGRTSANNWAIYDGPSSKAKLVAKGHGMQTLAGKWNNWFTLVFEDERFEGSTLQVMGANNEDEDSEWAIVGGTGEFAMARGIIERRVYSIIGSRLTQELTIEFFCHMRKEVVPAPKKRGPWGANGGSLREMEGKSQRLESVTINYLGRVHLIEFSYIDEDGRIRTSGTWGTVFEHPSTKNEIIRFAPSELVKQITLTGGLNGSSRPFVTNFRIVTNHKTYGPFGDGLGDWRGGTPFTYTVAEGETVVGFFAYTETYVNSVGVYTI